jgi:hypothetical protein
MHCVVDIAPGATAAHAYGPCCRIDTNVLDGGKVDDQAIITDAQTTGIVAPASNRNPQILFAAEMDGRHYVGYVGTLRDQTRLAIDHGIVDFALFLVFLGGRFYQITAELTLEFIDIFLLHVFLSFRYSGGRMKAGGYSVLL